MIFLSHCVLTILFCELFLMSLCIFCSCFAIWFRLPRGRSEIISSIFAGGGYVITPMNHGKISVVKHMLAIDWKCWRSYLQPSSARSITIRMLGRVAGIHELHTVQYIHLFL